ncbi:MAG: putative baseplate assembly protein [Armatimonadetes bacterium]|nr:putative baseplate assembly protein [Armatimonadota bacterium]
MSARYYCQHEKRRAKVLKSSALNGIDYLEVSDDQTTLTVRFLHNLPGQSDPVPPAPAPALTAQNVVIEGGVRVKDIRVLSAPSSGQDLILTVDAPGDFSLYTLRLVASPTQKAAPAGFDPRLSSISFSFKVDCPSDFDCRDLRPCPPVALPEPRIDYLAKDYASFRQLMLDRLGTILPDWKERNTADVGVALVEVMAYAADHLSYYQDAVANEAYLGTARRRVSVRRHARLLDYPMHDGCNARAWVQVAVQDDPLYADGILLKRQEASLRSRTRFLTRCLDTSVISPSGLKDVLSRLAPSVFEPMHDALLFPAHNAIRFYTWSDDLCCLPKGATCATLADDPARRLRLCPGDILVFEERLGPDTGLESDARLTRRHVARLKRAYPSALRTFAGGEETRIVPLAVEDPLTGLPVVEIEWDEEDALPFPLFLSAEIRGSVVADISVARGNIVLTDHGQTIEEDALLPEAAPVQGRYRPRLQNGPVTFAVSYEDAGAREKPARQAAAQAARDALPAVTLTGEGERWQPRRDLLGSDRFAPEFVAEVEEDGRAYLRFGDGVLGRQPVPGSRLKASYRVGNGRAGNVGADAITHIVTSVQGIAGVRNPLPAGGGAEPEAASLVKLYAPQAFRTQERAITESDYAAAAQRHPEVQRATATLRWTGSWHTMFLTIDRKEGRPVDAAFESEMRAFLERFRLAGHDLEIDGPRFAPLDIAMTVCVKPGYYKSAVRAALLQAFGSRDNPGGGRGFFHPDNFTFGQPVYLSRIVQAAMDVPGVLWVDTDETPPRLNRFRRWGQPSHGEANEGLMPMNRLEIARLDNDPSAQENGKIEFYMEGGL